jgi:hypothetical protein
MLTLLELKKVMLATEVYGKLSLLIESGCKVILKYFLNQRKKVLDVSVNVVSILS